MKRTDVKSHCPINFTVEIFGDAWSLLIYREIAAFGPRTFSQLKNAEERIGTSVLTERLAHLERANIIARAPDQSDKRSVKYSLTEVGLEALPILYEIAVWGSHTSPHPKMTREWTASLKVDKNVVLEAWLKALKKGSSFFSGPDSVVSQLNL